MIAVHFLDAPRVLPAMISAFRRARCAKIAVAFAKDTGFLEIRQELVSLLGQERAVQLVIGISSYGITDWSVLKALLGLKQRWKKLQVRCYVGESFHPKLFIFLLPSRTASMLIGSSNLTGGGIRDNVEANVLVEGNTDDRSIDEAINFFDEIFDRSKDLDKNHIEYCHALSQKQRKSRILPKRYGIAKTAPPPRLCRPPPRLPEKHFWKISPGKKAVDWKQWVKEMVTERDGSRSGIVAIGWNEIDLTRLPYDEWDDEKGPPRRLVNLLEKQLMKTGHDSSPKYVARQGLYFVKKMKRGDIIVAYSAGKIYGIAQVTGRPPYHVNVRDTSKEAYATRRPVRWLSFPAKIESHRISKVLAVPNFTILKITDDEAIRMVMRELQNPRL